MTTELVECQTCGLALRAEDMPAHAETHAGDGAIERLRTAYLDALRRKRDKIDKAIAQLAGREG